MTPAEVAAVIVGAPERARYVNFALAYHSNARPGGVSVLCKRDTYHGLIEITRMSKDERGRLGVVRTTWRFVGEDTEYESWQEVARRIADRILDDRYASSERGL
jgi:hypothetical protein